MNRDAISAFRVRASLEFADSLGTLIRISGKSFYAHVTVPKPSMSLEMGGFGTDKTISIRYPVGRFPKPALGTSVLLVAENLTFKVTTATSQTGSPLAAEVLVTAIRE